MSDQTTFQPSSVIFSFDDAVSIVSALGMAVAAINPAVAGGVAAITGIASLLNGTVIPAIKRSHDVQLSVLEQAQLATASAMERIRVGAPASVSN